MDETSGEVEKDTSTIEEMKGGRTTIVGTPMIVEEAAFKAVVEMFGSDSIEGNFTGNNYKIKIMIETTAHVRTGGERGKMNLHHFAEA